MPAGINDHFTKAKERWTGQIGAGGVADATVTTIPLASATGLPTDTAIYLAIDRVDANGDATSALFEVVKGVISSSNLTLAERGAEGTAQAHSAGAVVEFLSTAAAWNELVTGLLVEHNQDGTHATTIVKTTGAQTLAEKTLTSPTINTPTFSAGAVTTAAIADSTVTASQVATGQLLRLVDSTQSYKTQFGMSTVNVPASSSLDASITLPTAWPTAHVVFLSVAQATASWGDGSAIIIGGGTNSSLTTGLVRLRNTHTAAQDYQVQWISIGY